MDPNGRTPGRPPGLGRRDPLDAGPSDGDFAKLLEQASSPRAHRLGAMPDPLAGAVLRDSTRADAVRTGAPGALPAPRDETDAWGERVEDRDASAGAASGRSGARSSGAPPAARPPGATPPAWPRANGPVPGSPVPAGRWGALGSAPDPGSARTGPPDLVGTLERFRRASPRDRMVQALFAAAVIGILATIVDAALDSPGDGLGAVLVIGAAAFILFRGLFGKRPNRPPRP